MTGMKRFIVTHLGDKIDCKYVKHFLRCKEYIDDVVDSILLMKFSF